MQIAHQVYETDQNPSEMLEALFDQMTMGIVILVPEYRIQRFNTAWASYFDRYDPALTDSLKAGTGYFEMLPQVKPILEPLFAKVLHRETAQELLDQ